ncbi:MAG: hypothetical protein HY223_06080 [Thaumarchaeota archaeon]|nr:hypothetical protein [Nitrososphaerota archaeon]
MTLEMPKDSVLTFGWFYYTRGRASGIHKNHYLVQELGELSVDVTQ